MLFGNRMLSGVITTEKVICRAKHMLVWLMPTNGKSLYSALACCFFGPLRSIFELNETAASLHKCAVHYIRKNRISFSTDLENLYNILFPSHDLDPSSTFEQCCLYLMKPYHVGEGNCIRAIARIFSTPIVVHYEDGRELTRYDPVPMSSSTPVTVVRRMRPQGYHFDPVVDRTPEILLLRNTPPVQLPNTNLGHELMNVGHMLNVVTWDVTVCSNTEVQCVVDEALSSKDIHLACIQGTLPPQTSHGQALTPHYRWWFKVNTNKPSRSVAILVNQNCEGFVSNFVSASESLVSLDFNYIKNNFAVIGCDLPDSVDVKYNTASTELINALNRVPSSYQTLLLGQFNAEIGRKNLKNQERHLIGHRLYHHLPNNNGMLLTELAINRNLRIITTATNDKGTPVTYWANKNSQRNRDPLFKEKMSQISYILIKNWVNILEVQNFSWWETCSDHAVVGCRVALVPYSPLANYVKNKE